MMRPDVLVTSSTTPAKNHHERRLRTRRPPQPSRAKTPYGLGASFCSFNVAIARRRGRRERIEELPAACATWSTA